MESRNRWLGWAAIGLGLLVLVLAFGRGHGPRVGGFDRFEYAERQQERMWVQPGDVGPGGGFAFREERGFGGPGFGRGHFHGGPGFMFFPLFLLNTLFKLAGVVALAVLLLRLLSNRRNGGSSGQGGNGGSSGSGSPQGPPPPETYTGETTSL